MNKQFEIKDTGEAKMRLALQIAKDYKKWVQFALLKMHAEKMLERLGFDESRSVLMAMKDVRELEPWLPNLDKRSVCEDSIPFCETIAYRMYEMIGTRSNITFAIGKQTIIRERLFENTGPR